MYEHGLNMKTTSNLALVVIFVGLIFLSTTAPISATTAPTPNSNARIDATSAIPSWALTEWSVPTAASRPYDIAADTNGKLWFTENSANKLGKFDPTNDNFTEWTIPTPNSQPANIFVKLNATTSATEVYFTEFGASKIARFDSSTNTLTEWALASGANPEGIYVDETNTIWFTESGRDVIGRLVPITNTLTEWTLPGATASPGSPSLEPWGIYVQVVNLPLYTNRFVWFTETLGDKVGRLEVTSNRLTLWDLGTLGNGAYQPNDLTIGIFQSLPALIITNANNRVSILGNDTGGGSLYQETILQTLNSGPMGLTYDPARNAAWFAENNTGNIASYNTTNVLAGQLFTPTYCTIAPLAGTPACASPATTSTMNITDTASIPSGTAHLVSPVASSTVNIHQGPIGGVTEYALPAPEPRPAYLTVDSTGNVWFTESNATRIGRFSIPYIFGVSATPSTQTINPGQAATYSVSVALTSGAPQSLQLSLLGAPAGVNASFSPQSLSPPFSSTLTIATTNSTLTGAFSMTVQAVSAGETQTAPISLRIQSPVAPPFDFSVNVAAPTTETINQGQSASFSIIVGLVSGTPQIVNLAASGLPAGVTYSFTSPGGSPIFSSTLNIYTTVNTAGGTYPITITGTSVGVNHNAAQTPTLTIVELPRDFDLSSPVTQAVLVQSSKTDITLTLSAIGYFNGNVTLAGTFTPSSQLLVTFTPQSVPLQTNGTSVQTIMEITAPKNTVGTYQLTVTATSTNPSRTHQVTLSVQVSPCLIATATYGSAMAPQVQFLRDFRDREIMNTFAGSNFMIAFNAWYYSFSPAVAQYESQNPSARALARTALNPLISLLGVSESAFLAFGPASEVGALSAGLTAGFLIGLTYLAAPIFCLLWPLRRKITKAFRTRIVKITAYAFALFLTAFVGAEVLTSPYLMVISSAGLVLTALTTGGILPTLLATKLRRGH